MFYKNEILSSNVTNAIKKFDHEEVYAFYYKKIKGKMKLIDCMRFGIGNKYEIRNLDYISALNKYHNLRADGLVIVHNHPIVPLTLSKKVKPSCADLDFTWKIGEICESMNVNFIDHIIVSKYGYFSFVETNLIQNNIAI